MGGPPPSSPLPLSPQPAPGKPKVLGLPLWGWLGIGLVAIVGIGAVIVTSGDDDDKGTTPGNQTTVVVSTQPEETVTTEPSSGGEVAGAPDGKKGTRDAPVAAGEIADIGGGWRLQVLGVTPDAAALVAAENEFNDPPPAGSTFTLVSVAMGYFGLEDPKAAYEPSVSALGGSSVELESGCGSIPDELIVFNDLFAGGVLVGNLCFVTTPADAAGLQLYATGDFFSSDDAVFLEVAQPAAATAMAGLRGPQDGADSTPGRLQPTPLNTAAEVGDGWSVTVSSGARDITDSVLAENSFNEPPPAADVGDLASSNRCIAGAPRAIGSAGDFAARAGLGGHRFFGLGALRLGALRFGDVGRSRLVGRCRVLWLRADDHGGLVARCRPLVVVVTAGGDEGADADDRNQPDAQPTPQRQPEHLRLARRRLRRQRQWRGGWRPTHGRRRRRKTAHAARVV